MQETVTLVDREDEELQKDICPACEGTSFERMIGGILVYFNQSPEEFSGSRGYFETCTDPECIDSNGEIKCVECGAVVDEEASKKAGRIVLLEGNTVSEAKCPSCKDCHTFSYETNVISDLHWDEENGKFVEVEKHTEHRPLCCTACNALINEKASKEAGRIVLLADDEPIPNSMKPAIEVVFDAEMVQEFAQDTYDYEPSEEMVKAFFDDKDLWIVNYLHQAGWDLITSNACEYFRDNAMFRCKQCGNSVKYSCKEGFGPMQIERFNTMQLCEDCLRKDGDSE